MSKIELSGHYGLRRLLKATAPMSMMMIIISIYSVVDGFFISNYAGSDAFAGMNLIWPAIAVVGAIGTMTGIGGSALVSKTMGEGRVEEAQRIFTMIIRVTALIGVVCGVILFIFMPSLSDMLGTNQAMRPHAILYGRYMAVAIPFYMLQMAFQPFFMVAERPHWGTRLSIACGVTNMVFDALFVAVFGWGLTGAAVATILSLIVGGGFPLIFFRSRRNTTRLRLTSAKVHWPSIIASCTNGLSEFVGNIAFNVVGICYNLQLMKYIGANGVSAYGIIMYMGFIFAAIFIGYNMGVTQIIAYNYGAGNREELRSLLQKSLIIIGVYGVLMCIFSQTTAPLIARIFVGFDPELCELSTKATRIYMYSFLLCGFNMFASAWFTALNNGIVSAVAAFVRTMILELLCVMVLPSIFGVDGIWMSVNVAESLCLIMSIWLIVAYAGRYGYGR